MKNTISHRVADFLKNFPPFTFLNQNDIEVLSEQISIIYKENPRYITKTIDSAKVFQFNNLKEGKYFLIALKDENRNNKFDPKIDKIAFFNEPITVPTTTMYELELFAEKAKFKVEKPTQESNNKLFIGYSGDAKNTKVTAKNNGKEVPIKLTKCDERPI